MEIKYPEIGICGLSCRLCPNFQSTSASRCLGCKSADRMAVGCPFITCAIKKVGVEFCWECPDSQSCEKWKKHRHVGKSYDSFKCYQKLEVDIHFIQTSGVIAFDEQQRARELLLRRLIGEFNDGRSKSYYCISATVMDTAELSDAIEEASVQSQSLSVKDKAKTMHALLDSLAAKKGYLLLLRK